jgi:hypothetical protein
MEHVNLPQTVMAQFRKVKVIELDELANNSDLRAFYAAEFGELAPLDAVHLGVEIQPMQETVGSERPVPISECTRFRDQDLTSLFDNPSPVLSRLQRLSVLADETDLRLYGICALD